MACQSHECAEPALAEAERPEEGFMLDNDFHAAYSSFMVKHRFRRVKLALAWIPLILLLAGCDGRDAQFRKQIVGTWSAQEASDLFILADGSFRHTNDSVYPPHIVYGTWEVKRGILIFSTTEKTSDKPLTNYVASFKIEILNQTNLLCEDTTTHNQFMSRYRNIQR